MDRVNVREVDVGAVVRGCPAVQELYSDIVPKYVSDDTFWKNLFWRLEFFACCSSIDQALRALRIVNVEPTPAPSGTRRKGHWQGRQRNAVAEH